MNTQAFPASLLGALTLDIWPHGHTAIVRELHKSVKRARAIAQDDGAGTRYEVDVQTMPSARSSSKQGRVS
jgi:hypothetical protein